MLPHAATVIDRIITARNLAGRLLLGLDYDGTLAPIVPDPDDAALPSATIRILQSLAARTDTCLAFLSGRALADIKRRVGIENAYYAGNHGLEVEGPDLHFEHERAQAVRPVLAELAERLASALASLPITQLEYKGLTLSVHYRRVFDEPTAREVRAIVEHTCAPYQGLHLSHGKKVVELRPDVDWHKGEALRLLRDVVAVRTPTAPTVFVGDDRTDEDGFRQVGENGIAIVVADPLVRETAAHAFLRSPVEVADFLQRLDAP